MFTSSRRRAVRRCWVVFAAIVTALVWLGCPARDRVGEPAAQPGEAAESSNEWSPAEIQVLKSLSITSSVADSSLLALTTSMTLSAWLYPTLAPSGWSAVIQKGPEDYYLHVGSSTGVPAGGGLRPAYDVAPLPVNVWTHLAVSYDGTRYRLYRDGVEVGTRGRSGLQDVTTLPLMIGNNDSGESFTGRIDEVRVYDVVLTPEEIAIDISTAAAAP
jgi:hypothetical protein